ncbi:hypothetical protein B0H16DRAFT_1879829 [Mycena metata]|uniref:Uncharacterized protein n=1 Tax=Mycena metata TaxID=1033252 RepID=A0AAD7K2C4_9AGAR|nr:hypothetical protein B0H16DRAFT_1879829 [Mycena metata]
MSNFLSAHIRRRTGEVRLESLSVVGHRGTEASGSTVGSGSGSGWDRDGWVEGTADDVENADLLLRPSCRISQFQSHANNSVDGLSCSCLVAWLRLLPCRGSFQHSHYPRILTRPPRHRALNPAAHSVDGGYAAPSAFLYWTYEFRRDDYALPSPSGGQVGVGVWTEEIRPPTPRRLARILPSLRLHHVYTVLQYACVYAGLQGARARHVDGGTVQSPPPPLLLLSGASRFASPSPARRSSLPPPSFASTAQV